MRQTIWINIAIGFWLVIAAFTQHSDLMRGLRMYNDLGIGVLLLCCALWYQMEPGAATVANLFLGAWLVAAPFLLAYHPTNDVLCGMAVVIVALVEGRPALLRHPPSERVSG